VIGWTDKSKSRGAGRAGAVLLEVLVTVTLIVMFMALIGSQILAAVEAAAKVDRRQNAMLLAESLVGRLQAGGFDLADQEDQITGDFGELYPGWAWKITAEPVQDDEALMRVNLQIFYDESGEAGEAVGDVIESLAPVLSLHTFWAVAPQVDLARDFGLDEESLSGLADVFSNEGFDARDLDPSWLTNLGPEQLKELVGALSQAAESGALADAMRPGGPLSGISGLLSRGRGGRTGGGGRAQEGPRRFTSLQDYVRNGLLDDLRSNGPDAVRQRLEELQGQQERPASKMRGRSGRQADEPGAQRRSRRPRLRRPGGSDGGEKAGDAGRRRPRRGRASGRRR